MEEQVKEGQNVQHKLSYDELKRVASQLRNEVENWKRKAYEEAGKISRISLLLECLKLQCGYVEFNRELFNAEDIKDMSNELVETLYPPKEAPVVPLVKTEAVN